MTRFRPCRRGVFCMTLIGVSCLSLLPLAEAQEQIEGTAPVQVEAGTPDTAALAAPPANPFHAQDIHVDIRAENAVKAREQAFGTALGLAYRQICTQVTNRAHDCQQAPLPDTASLGRALKDFTTTQEQIGAARYTATYNMRFRSGVTKHLLASVPVTTSPEEPPAGAGVSAALSSGAAPAMPAPMSTPASSKESTSSQVTLDAPIPAHQAVSSPSTTNGEKATPEQPAQDNARGPTQTALIIPFYQKGARAILWSGDNPLRDALSQIDLGGTALRMPLGELEDIQMIDEKAGMNLTAADLAPLVKKYKADTAILAVAIPSGNDQKSITVMIYHPKDKGGRPDYIDSLSLSPSSGSSATLDEPTLYNRAAATLRDRSLALIARIDKMPSSVAKLDDKKTTDPKGPSVMPSPIKGHMNVRITYKDMQEWQKIKSRLQANAAITHIQVNRLTTNEASVRLDYAGQETNVLQELQARGIQIRAHAGASPSAAPASAALGPQSSTSGWQMNNIEPAAGDNDTAQEAIRYDLGLMSWQGDQ